MSTDLGPTSSQQFSIARVLKDMVRVLRANLLGSAIVTIAYVVLWYLPVPLAYESSEDAFSWWNFVVRELMGLVVWGLTSAIFIHLTLLTLMGSQPSLRDLPRGLPLVLPMIVVLAICDAPSILSRLVGTAETSEMPKLGPQIAITLVAYIVSTFLFVAAPVVAAERLGPLVALKRSVALTAGSRWRVFGLLLMIGIAFWGLQLAIWQVGNALNAQVGHTGPNLVSWIGDFVFPAIQLIVWSVVQTVAYAAIRLEKEGASALELARVFD